MITDINSEDQLVQQTFADLLEKVLGWESAYAYDTETFGPAGTPGRASEREAVRVVRGPARSARALRQRGTRCMAPFSRFLTSEHQNSISVDSELVIVNTPDVRGLGNRRSVIASLPLPHFPRNHYSHKVELFIASFSQ